MERVPIDNDFYNREALAWWDETRDSPLMTIRYSIHPVRWRFALRVIGERLTGDHRARRVLDVGCGGGYIAEEIARLGFRTTGVDPSASSLREARRHAECGGLGIDYVEGVGERLPFADESFDLVFCCDVLEHVEDPDRVIGEIARVMRPGGLFFYETINRTLLSRLFVIKLLQQWRFTAVLPPDIHCWDNFITPREIRAMMRRSGLRPAAMRGIRPSWNFPLNLFLLWRTLNSRIGFYELCRTLRCRESRFTWLCYMGFAERK